MSTSSSSVAPGLEEIYAPVPVELKNRWMAGFLAWLFPGAGHLYQGRSGKGLLFLICILGIFMWGLALGDGQVVYASFPSMQRGLFHWLRGPEMRYPFFLQAGIGAPAVLALVQFGLVSQGYSPLFGNEAFAPPPGPLHEQYHDALAVRHEKLKAYFELGSLYTMIAGILNMFAIYDACCGPLFARPPASQRSERAKIGPAPDEPAKIADTGVSRTH